MKKEIIIMKFERLDSNGVRCYDDKIKCDFWNKEYRYCTAENFDDIHCLEDEDKFFIYKRIK